MCLYSLSFLVYLSFHRAWLLLWMRIVLWWTDSSTHPSHYTHSKTWLRQFMCRLGSICKSHTTITVCLSPDQSNSLENFQSLRLTYMWHLEPPHLPEDISIQKPRPPIKHFWKKSHGVNLLNFSLLHIFNKLRHRKQSMPIRIQPHQQIM